MTNKIPNHPAGVRRFSAKHLLIALLLLFMTSPFVQELPGGRLIQGALLTLVLLSAFLAVSGQASLAFGTLLALLTIAGHWAGLAWPGGFFAAFCLLPAIVFLGFVVARLLQSVLQAADVSSETLCASISGFLMIGLLWTMIYMLVARLTPGAFSFSQTGRSMDGFDAFYFSFVTLATIGYGDITPLSRVARMLVVMEAITGMFYVTILVARLVSIHSSKPAKSP